MGSKLDEVLAKARAEAADKKVAPGTAAIINQLETEATQRIFQPPAIPPESRKLIRVAVGGRIDGEEFLNVSGIK